MPVLVLVDVQKEYIAEGRPFCLETIGPSLDNLRKLLAHARAKGWKVIHMRHQQNAEDIRSLVNGNHRAGNSEGRRADGFTELKDCVKVIHGRSLFQI